MQVDLQQVARGLVRLFERLTSAKRRKSKVTYRGTAQPEATRAAIPPPDLEFDLPFEPTVAKTVAAPSVTSAPVRAGLLASLRDTSAVRDAFVLKEILDRPRAVRPYRRR